MPRLEHCPSSLRSRRVVSLADGGIQSARTDKSQILNYPQFICGWLGDRVGRRNIIVAGLLVCVLGMCIFVGVGATLAEPLNGFLAASSILGIGTALMYSSALAAIVDHSDPTWRSSALGAYRFWRDLGYAIGALITGKHARTPEPKLSSSLP